MQVLAYEANNSVTDHHDFMLKLKNFAQGQGWTASDWKTNIQWASDGGGGYDFVAGTEDFLELRSNGYSAQGMQYRFKMENTGAGYSRYLRYGGFHGTIAYDYTSSIHPYLRAAGAVSKWNTYGSIAISSTTMPAVWFFGNEKIIIAVIKYDTTFIQAFAFGTLELIDSAEAEAHYLSYLYPGDVTWESKTSYCPFDFLNGAIYWDGGGKTYPTNINYSFYCSSGKYTVTDSSFVSYGKSVLIENKYSDNRSIIQQEIFGKDSADGQWQHLGRHWVGRLQHDGLKIGEELTYGSERYITFPYKTIGVDTLGFAVRIA